jgi:hypothetical protein
MASSGSGQSRRTTLCAMFGLAPTAAVMLQCRDRSKSATSGHEQMQQRRLVDHLVGGGEQHWWHSEAKRLGSLEIDDQLVLGRSLHRQVHRLFAF